MSVHIPIEERHRLPWHRRLLPLVAVGAAHLIGRLSPRRIRRLLTWCAHRAQPATYVEAAAARQAVRSQRAVRRARLPTQLDRHRPALSRPRNLAHLAHRSTHPAFHRSDSPSDHRCPQLTLC